MSPRLLQQIESQIPTEIVSLSSDRLFPEWYQHSPSPHSDNSQSRSTAVSPVSQTSETTQVPWPLHTISPQKESEQRQHNSLDHSCGYSSTAEASHALPHHQSYLCSGNQPPQLLMYPTLCTNFLSLFQTQPAIVSSDERTPVSQCSPSVPQSDCSREARSHSVSNDVIDLTSPPGNGSCFVQSNVPPSENVKPIVIDLTRNSPSPDSDDSQSHNTTVPPVVPSRATTQVAMPLHIISPKLESEPRQHCSSDHLNPFTSMYQPLFTSQLQGEYHPQGQTLQFVNPLLVSGGDTSLSQRRAHNQYSTIGPSQAPVSSTSYSGGTGASSDDNSLIQLHSTLTALHHQTQPTGLNRFLPALQSLSWHNCLMPTNVPSQYEQPRATTTVGTTMTPLVPVIPRFHLNLRQGPHQQQGNTLSLSTTRTSHTTVVTTTQNQTGTNSNH